MTRRPPLAARLLLRLVLRGEIGELVRGDLDEEFHDALAAGSAARAAARRYWRQALASVAAARRPAATTTQAMSAIGSFFRSGLTSDVRYVVRRLRASPGFTAVAILSLAVGIGANTAVASAARAALFDSLPVERPGELWFLFWGPRLSSLDGMYMDGDTDPSSGQRIVSNVTYPAYDRVRAAAGESASLGAFTFIPRTNVVIGSHPAESAAGILADGTLFSVLRPPMAIGRVLTDADDRPGAEPAAVISYDFWQRTAGGSPSILDAPVSVNGVPLRIVGVTGQSFRGLSPGGFRPATDITLPLALQGRIVPSWTPPGESLFTSPRYQWMRALVRLPDGTSPESFETRATAALRAHVIDAGLADAATAATVRGVLRPAGRGINIDAATTRRSVEILAAIVAVVLFIACLNLAGLMLARGVSRRHEFSVRAALGASRSHLVRLAFMESGMLAISGAAVGVGLLAIGRTLLSSMLVDGLGPVIGQVAIDGRLLAVTAGVAFAAATTAAVLPALQWSGSRTRLSPSRRPGGGTPPRHTIGRALVAIQIAVSLPLLGGAGLLLRTMYNLTHVDLGFAPESLVTFRVEAPADDSPPTGSPVYGRILDQVERVGGVRHASMVENTLIAGVSSTRTALVDGQRRLVYVNGVGPGFFETLAVPVLAGRTLDARDATGPEKVVLNRTAAERLFGGAAVGRRFTIPAPPGGTVDRDVEVVGVVSDTKYTSLRAATPPTIFDYYARRSITTLIGMTFMVRADRPAAALERPLRDAVARASAGIAATAYRTQADQIAATIGRERIFARLLTLFGAFALLLAAMGLYGATAYTVERRASEIGVRIALGARRAQVLWMILRQVGVVAMIGLSIGIPTALAAATLLSTMLFGLTATDPATLTGAAATLLAVVLLAGLVPARRAARIDPLTAIRTD